jgi:hypothetical protein
VDETENNFEPEVNGIAKSLGIPHLIRISDELQLALKPNEFLGGLGIRFNDRVKNVLEVVKAGLIPHGGGPEEALPGKGLAIPFVFTQGPFIREVPVSIKAELQKDKGGRDELAVCPEEDSNFHAFNGTGT